MEEETTFEDNIPKKCDNEIENSTVTPQSGKSDVETMKPSKVDQITAVIGETGKWQLQRIAIVFFISIPGLAHIFVSPFSMPKTDFWCYDELTDSNHTKNECLDSCKMYQHDLSFWEETVISQYDLVCQRSYLPTLSKMLFFGGFGLGTFISGIISDSFGRKKSLIGFSLLIFVSGVACSFMPNYISFTVMWIVVGIAAVANFTVAFVWVMELASGKWKIILGMGMQFGWPLSRMFVLVCAWLLPNWRRIMQVISAPMLAAPIFLYLLPESPRWLVAKGRISDAKTILGNAVASNNLEVDMDKVVLAKPGQARKGTLLDIFKYPDLRTKTLIMYFNWFSSSFMMYGLALNWQNLTGNLWITFMIAAFLDFPAKGFAVVSLLFYGRKLPYVGLTFIAGVFFLAILCIPRGVFEDELPIVILSLIASFCVSSSFSMLWMWMSELMPTTVRNAGVGSSSMVARIGGVLATTVGNLADISPVIPISMFMASAFISATLSLFLPETQGTKLPDTPEESEENKLLGIREGIVNMFAHVKNRRAE